jgi:hypothetical protein
VLSRLRARAYRPRIQNRARAGQALRAGTASDPTKPAAIKQIVYIFNATVARMPLTRQKSYISFQ